MVGQGLLEQRDHLGQPTRRPRSPKPTQLRVDARSAGLVGRQAGMLS
jgi:hypothetical protein